MSAACRAGPVDRSTVYRLRQQSATFRAAWDEALAEGLDNLEVEAWRRARNGSDGLMIMLLRAYLPAKYALASRSMVTRTKARPPVVGAPARDDRERALLAAAVQWEIARQAAEQGKDEG